MTGSRSIDPLTGQPGLSPFVMAALALVPPPYGGPVLLPYKVATYLNLGPIRNRGFEASIEHRFNDRVDASRATTRTRTTRKVLDRGLGPDPLSRSPRSASRRRTASTPARQLQRAAFPRQPERQLLGQGLLERRAERALLRLHRLLHACVNATVGMKFAEGKAQFSLRGTNLLNQKILQHVYGDMMRISVVAELRFFAK